MFQTGGDTGRLLWDHGVREVVLHQALEGVASEASNTLDRAPDRTPDIHIDVAFLERGLGLVGRQQVAHALGAGLVGVVIVDHAHGFAEFPRGSGLRVGDTQRVVEDQNPRGTGRRGDDLLDFRVVDPLELFAVEEVLHRGLVLPQLEALALER